MVRGPHPLPLVLLLRHLHEVQRGAGGEVPADLPRPEEGGRGGGRGGRGLVRRV